MSMYLIRGQSETLDSSTTDSTDTLFVNQRFEQEVLTGVRFSQCTFANVSFKEAKLIDCHFSACVFEGCYFRKTELQECHFPAARFINCEFPKTRIYACGFGNTRFQRTAPQFAILEPSLPGEANLCRDLCENIATEASALGYERDARRYRLRAIHEKEEALRRGFMWSDQYSKEHYPELERLRAFGAFLLSRASGLLWGHGEYIRRLLGNLLMISFVIGPILLFLSRDHLDGPKSFWDCVVLSVASVLNASEVTGTSASGIALVLILFLSASGLLFLGLFVTYVFQAVTRR